MSLIEENLPGVGRVKKDFQVKEDFVIARQLQEREFEEHFDLNVQQRRSAMRDAKVAKSFQNEETVKFQESERKRLALLEEQAEHDRKEAERFEAELKRQEEEAKRKDEEIVLQMHRQEMERAAKLQRQEQEDMLLAQRHIEVEKKKAEEKRRLEILKGEEEARRLQQMETGSKGMELPTYESLGFSMPPLPTQQQNEEEEEEFVDEAARLEEEDARLARELMEREQREAERRKREQELADIEFARKLHEMESKKKQKTATSSDEELARRMTAAHDSERRRQLEAQRKADEELALKVRADLMRRDSEQESTDWELAKKLQKAEIIAHKKKQQLQGASGGPTQRSHTVSTPPTQSLPPTSSVPASLPINKRGGTEPVLTGYQMPPDDDVSPSTSLPPGALQNYKRQTNGSKQNKKSSRSGKK